MKLKEFFFRTVVVRGTKFQVQMWDTAGQERYRSTAPQYYRDTDGFLLMYDITQARLGFLNLTVGAVLQFSFFQRHSFENVPSWLNIAREYSDDAVPILLVGHKLDMSAIRQVTTEEAKLLAGVEFPSVDF